jgi:hypothetical protein
MSNVQVQKNLLKMVNGLNMPLSVSSQDGAIRAMEDRINKIREGQVQSLGSCNPPFSSWGN